MKNNRDEIMDEYFKLISSASDKGDLDYSDYIKPDFSEEDMQKFDDLHQDATQRAALDTLNNIGDNSSKINLEKWKGLVKTKPESYKSVGDKYITDSITQNPQGPPALPKQHSPLESGPEELGPGDFDFDINESIESEDLDYLDLDADPSEDVGSVDFDEIKDQSKSPISIRDKPEEVSDEDAPLTDNEMIEMTMTMPDLIIEEKLYESPKYQKFAKVLLSSLPEWFMKNKNKLSLDQLEDILDAISYMTILNKDISKSLDGNDKRNASAFKGKLRKHMSLLNRQNK